MAVEDDEDLTEEDSGMVARMIAEAETRHHQRLQLLATLEKRIGIPEGFLWSLLDEKNDWAYILKLSVFCEAALTHMLVLAVDNEQLYEHFSDLPQGRRLGLTKQLGILSDADRHTLGAIAQVRNSFAHRVENLAGSLHDFFLSRTQAEQIDLLTRLAQLEGNQKPKTGEDFSGHAKMFRLMLFASCMVPIQSIANFGLEVDKRAADELAWTLADMFKQNIGNR